ncbi:LOW QUALITY PROTEIN: cell growth regulator with EF hand domain protein 1-like [Pelecanus crispus]|uniref:LOW QUALITY PROTEIN: cell growth regulator with EF hand domain protein 1-like n=1 Tax=Pelecanus crispus TaxID=36300 RepID=UPI003F5D44CD
MRNLLLLLLLLLLPAARAAPKAGGHRPEAPVAMKLDPEPDPLSTEPPTLPLLRSAVRSLGPPERDAEAMTREQALLYLFVLHDHDRSGRLDGLELLQLLGAVLAQRDGGRPDPDLVAALVDRALERQDLSRDGLLDPPELLLSPGRGPPGQPLRQQRGGTLAGAGAAPGGHAGVSGPGHGTARGQAAPWDGAPRHGAMEAEEAPQDGAPRTEAMEAEEAPQHGAPQAGAPHDVAPGSEAPQDGAMEAEEAPPGWSPRGRGSPSFGGDPGEG